MHGRLARHTERLEAVVAFYRDGLGLPEIGGFRDHAGYDGVFLDLPGTGAHLEFTAGGGGAPPAPPPGAPLALYLGDEGAGGAGAGAAGAAPGRPPEPPL